MSSYPKTPQAVLGDTTNLLGTGGRNVTFASTPGTGQKNVVGFNATPSNASRNPGTFPSSPGDLFGSPAMRRPESASIQRKKDQFRQRRMEKGHPVAQDASGVAGGVLRGQQMGLEQDTEFRSEFDLLYPQAAHASRGAGSGPGLAAGLRGASQYYDGNTSTANALGTTGFMSPAAGGTLGGGALTPIPNNMTSYSLATPGHQAQHTFVHDDTQPLHPALRAAAPDDAPTDNWITVFGFPPGYHDGVLRHLRDRGDILESHYSGTNYISVKFKRAETVAEALGLNGCILPGDGLPGDNFMIGVKRGAQMPGKSEIQEAQNQFMQSSFDQFTSSNIKGVDGRTTMQSAVPGSSVKTGNKPGSTVGRFLSELFNIVDVSAQP